MFCIYCKHYQGIESNCAKDKDIWNYKEVLECTHYTYNGEVMKWRSE